MNELPIALALVLGIMAGVCMTLGVILVFVFYGSDDLACHSALYGFISLLY